MRISFAPEAAKDLDDAVEWYESERKGLGKLFAKTIDESVLRIARYPFFGTEVKTADCPGRAGARRSRGGRWMRR